MRGSVSRNRVKGSFRGHSASTSDTQNGLARLHCLSLWYAQAGTYVHPKDKGREGQPHQLFLHNVKRSRGKPFPRSPVSKVCVLEMGTTVYKQLNSQQLPPRTTGIRTGNLGSDPERTPRVQPLRSHLQHSRTKPSSDTRGLFFILNFIYFYFSCTEDLSVCLCAMCVQCPRMSEEGARAPGTGVMDGWEPPVLGMDPIF